MPEPGGPTGPTGRARGLVKPLTQSGRKSLSHKHRVGNRVINANVNNARGRGRGGILCGGRNDSLFVSSYHADKKLKRRRQTTERLRRWLATGALALVVVAVVTSRDSLRPTTKEQAPRLGGAGTGVGTAIGSDVPPPAPKPEPTAPTLPEINRPNTVCGSDPGGTRHTVAAAPDGFLCSRKIPVTLSNPTTWSTPYTNILAGAVAQGGGEVVLLGRGGGYGGLGSSLSAFFHAYDFAFEKKRPLYLTQDSWALDVLYELFFGPSVALERNDELWAAVEQSLQVKVVEDAAALTAAGKTVSDPVNSHGLFWNKPAGVDASQIRDQRNTVLRMLFQYPAVLGVKDVCSAVNTVIKNEKEKKYAVVHFGAPAGDRWRKTVENGTGKNLLAATEMRPDYVKSILKGAGMLGNEIYLVHSDSSNIDVEAHTRLLADPELKDTLKDVDREYSGCLGSNIYLAVLADLYIGSPADAMSLWVARMRYALGIKNTFVFTEKRLDQWVSYLDDDRYLDLYDVKKLGPFMG